MKVVRLLQRVAYGGELVPAWRDERGGVVDLRLDEWDSEPNALRCDDGPNHLTVCLARPPGHHGRAVDVVHRGDLAVLELERLGDADAVATSPRNHRGLEELRVGVEDRLFELELATDRVVTAG